MSSVILEAHDLTKEYRHTVALDHIDLKIEKGKIYGFIGQNGAGKTTFLRLVTGLAFPTSGTLSLWGKTVEKELQEQRKRIGCMIETPALFPTMTAYQNMEIQRIQRGIPDKAVIQKTLDMVGLKDTGKKAVRNFSLGMRQRLGIAIALLNTPEFLILDEPINGLDPAGIVEIRNLLKSLNKEYGMTILVSSHILEELYQTASEFMILCQEKVQIKNDFFHLASILSRQVFAPALIVYSCIVFHTHQAKDIHNDYESLLYYKMSLCTQKQGGMHVYNQIF